MQSITNLAALRLYNYYPETIYLQGYSTVGDGGEGVFYWDKNDTTSSDNDGTVIIGTGAGRWKRVTNGYTNARWFGCKGDGTDVTTKLQNIITYLGTLSYFSTLYLPAGNYTISSTLNLPCFISIKGDGYGTIISASACDALTITSVGSLGPSSVSDLRIIGSAATAHIGINIPGTANKLDQVNGLIIENVLIGKFLTGIYARTLWHSEIKSVTLYEIWNGIQIVGQSVKVIVEDCKIMRGDITGSGISNGILITTTSDYSDGTHRPEDVQVHTTLTSGFDIGCIYTNCLYGRIIDNDFDTCGVCGVSFTGSDGGLTISGNWIALRGANGLYGIHAEALSSPGVNMPSIERNYIQGDAPNSNSVGIYIDTNQNNVLINANEITGMLNQDIFAHYTKNLKVVNNNCASTGTSNSIYIVSTYQNTFIDGNIVQQPIFVHPTSNGNVIVESTYGIQSTLIRGKSTMLSGHTTVTTSFSSLNGAPADFITGSTSFLGITVEIVSADLVLGVVSGTGTSSSVTLYCQTAPSADVVIRWIARATTNLD